MLIENLEAKLFHHVTVLKKFVIIIFALRCLVAGSCECGNEPSGSTKRGEFLD
jgi:hypothetical protein